MKNIYFFVTLRRTGKFCSSTVIFRQWSIEWNLSCSVLARQSLTDFILQKRIISTAVSLFGNRLIYNAITKQHEGRKLQKLVRGI